MTTVYALVMCFGVHCSATQPVYETEKLCQQDAQSLARGLERVGKDAKDSIPVLRCENRPLIRVKPDEERK